MKFGAALRSFLRFQAVRYVILILAICGMKILIGNLDTARDLEAIEDFSGSDDLNFDEEVAQLNAEQAYEESENADLHSSIIRQAYLRYKGCIGR